MNLRQAAEMALEALEDIFGKEKKDVGAINALRQALTPEVTPEVPCKTDPRAPHGFDRNASHSADRYVCECEGWEPPKREWVCCVCGDPKALGIVHSADAPCFHYTKREWVGLTKEDFYKKDDETVFVLGMKFAEARLKEKKT
jgi:hypothetical protein